jgi:hypothetical protein
MPTLLERAQRRERAIQRFAERQRATDDRATQGVRSGRPSLGLAYRRRCWVSFADLADWCAAATTTAGIVEQKKARILALHSLAVSINKGEFEQDRKSKVLFLAPYIPGDDFPPRCRLIGDHFEYIGELDFVAPEMLAQLWLPCDLAQSWLESHGYRGNPHFDMTQQSRLLDDAPGPKGGEASIQRTAWLSAERILASDERPKRGHGRLSKLARLVTADLERAGVRRQPDSIRKAIRAGLREWEVKHPKL